MAKKPKKPQMQKKAQKSVQEAVVCPNCGSDDTLVTAGGYADGVEVDLERTCISCRHSWDVWEQA